MAERKQASASALCDAAARGWDEEVATTLRGGENGEEKGGRPHTTRTQLLCDAKGTPAIAFAAAHGRVTVVETLLRQGMGVDSEDRAGKTPLHWAAAGGHLAVVEMLCKWGAWGDAVDVEGDTPMHFAVRRGGSEGGGAVAAALLASGAAISVRNNSDFSPLDEAVLRCDEDLLDVLTKRETSPALVTKLLTASSPCGYPLLCLAALVVSEEAVRWLLGKGVPIDVREKKEGYTPLMLACSAAVEGRGKEVAALAAFLLKTGADISIRTKTKNESAWSLACASQGMNDALLAVLRRHGGEREEKKVNGGVLRPKTEAELFLVAPIHEKDDMLLRWASPASIPPFPPETEGWSRFAKDIGGILALLDDYKLVRSLRNDRDFQDDMNAPGSRKAVELVVASPTEIGKLSPRDPAMRALNKLRRMQSMRKDKGTKFPLDYIVVSSLSDAEFELKVGELERCKSNAMTFARRLAYTQLKPKTTSPPPPPPQSESKNDDDDGGVSSQGEDVSFKEFEHIEAESTQPQIHHPPRSASSLILQTAIRSFKQCLLGVLAVLFYVTVMRKLRGKEDMDGRDA